MVEVVIIAICMVWVAASISVAAFLDRKGIKQRKELKKKARLGYYYYRKDLYNEKGRLKMGYLSLLY